MNTTIKDPLTLLTNDPAELAVLRLKSRIMMNIAETKRQSGLSQVQFAKLAGTSQSRISKIMNGRMSKVTIDLLIAIAERTDTDWLPSSGVDNEQT